MKVTGSIIMLATLAVSTVMGLKEAPKKLAIGIKKRIPEEQCTRKTKNGDTISVHYVGTLFDDGKEFDSSRKRDNPIEFVLGAGNVIKGWDQGLLGMCIGEKRKLIIPYDLAYGEAGSPPTIPAKATLVFETELMGIKGYKQSKAEDKAEEEVEKLVDELNEKAESAKKEDSKKAKKSDKSKKDEKKSEKKEGKKDEEKPKEKKAKGKKKDDAKKDDEEKFDEL